ncbi:25036_t:CDS:2, partial [Gigaspora margarita]
TGGIWMLVQSPGIVLVLFVVCGIISLLGSSIYVELGIRSLPRGIVGLVRLSGADSTNWSNVFNKPSKTGVYELGAYGNGLIQ